MKSLAIGLLLKVVLFGILWAISPWLAVTVSAWTVLSVWHLINNIGNKYKKETYLDKILLTPVVVILFVYVEIEKLLIKYSK